MELKKSHIIGIVLGIFILGISLFFSKTNYFFLMIGIGIIIIIIPFVLASMRETRISSEKEEMFLEFTRNLVESVKAGTPISKSIINVKGKSYGVLSDNVQKLANQIELGIPLNLALRIFSKDVNDKSISRALTLIGQAERAGGEIGEILEAVAEAVGTTDKLKKERKAAISTLVAQGYIIFFVFILILLIMQFQILPMVSGIGDVGSMGGNANIIGAGVVRSSGGNLNQTDISNSFLYLLLAQGFFAGLTIGKLAEGNFKAGIKHSFVLMVSSFLISAGVNAFFG